MSGPKNILLLGHPRSGTTLLRRLLDAHPDIAAPPELHLLGACARFLRTDRNAVGLEIGALSGLAFAGFDEAEVLARLRKFAFSFLDDFAERQGKARWVEKTAFDVFEIDGIERFCGDRVHYLGIIRHPVDVALSTIDFCAQMGRYPQVLHNYVVQYSDPYQAFLHSWADTTRSLMALGERRPESVTLCLYEDLLEDPKELLAGLLDAFGVPAFDAAGTLGGLDNPGFSDHKAFAKSSVERPEVPRWRSLPDLRLSEAAPIVAELMAALGYDPLPDTPPLTQAEARRAYIIGLNDSAGRG